MFKGFSLTQVSRSLNYVFTGKSATISTNLRTSRSTSTCLFCTAANATAGSNPVLITRKDFKKARFKAAAADKYDETLGVNASPSGPEIEPGGLKPTSCQEVLESGQVGHAVRIQGWVRGIRTFKSTQFLDINDGSTFHRLPVVIGDVQHKSNRVSLLASVDVTGELVQNPKKPAVLEIHPTRPIAVLGTCDQTKYPMAGKWEAKYEPEHIRQYYHLRFKTSKFASMLRLRSFTSQAIHDYFNQNNYVQIHTPIITSNDCEGAGEIFTVLPAASTGVENPQREPSDISAFFDEPAYLSVSGQLHLEAITGGLEKAWTFSPIFRAENNQSTRHLTEFYMVEAELAFMYQIEQLLRVMEDLVKFCLNRIVYDKFAEFNYYCDEKPEQKIFLEAILKHPFTIMTFEEACHLLKSKADSTVPAGKGLNREQELILVEKLNNSVPVFLINWPRDIKPFYMRQCPGDSTHVSAVDLLVPRIGELCGGSLRENNLAILESNINGIDAGGGLRESLDWYLDLRRYGSVPTGGFGLGFDRLLQLMFGCHNIKDVCPFPRWPHNCPM